MTIAALRALLDDAQPDVPRHPAPQIPQIAARKRKIMNQSSPVPGPRSTQEAPSAGQAPLAVGALIAWAIAHDTKSVARKGIQARELLAELRGLYADAERIAKADAEEQRLLQALAAVRARKEQLRPKRKTSGVDQAAVRAWARANGHTVPDRGNVPAAIVAAWRGATGGAR